MGELIAHGVTGFLVEDIDSAVAAVASAGELDRRRIAGSWPPTGLQPPP
jgi:hypothetical protein